MPRIGRRIIALGLASVLSGCVAEQPVPSGSLAQTQLHAPCPATGGCAEPLSCVGGEQDTEPATCELACNGECPLPLQCMPRSDGKRGGVCTAPPTRAHAFGN